MLDSSFSQAIEDLHSETIEDTLVLLPHRLATTNNEGKAEFEKVTVMDVREVACVRFVFIVGDSGI